MDSQGGLFGPTAPTQPLIGSQPSGVQPSFGGNATTPPTAGGAVGPDIAHDPGMANPTPGAPIQGSPLASPLQQGQATNPTPPQAPKVANPAAPVAGTGSPFGQGPL